MTISATFDDRNGLEIAIIGMAGRFPGARNVDELWNNIRDGVCSIARLSDQELATAGIAAAELHHPHYVKARGILRDSEFFDASFFGYSPRDAEIMDPQHRFFLECAYEALEDAGYDPDRYDGLIGVYGGTSINSYLISLLRSNPDLITSIGNLQLVVGSDKDHLTTRVSYKLNLKGPSLDVNTSCSTSLVAIHLACRNLLAGECDMALAGGVSINVPQQAGYLYQEGGVTSPDGYCRAFDADAQGAVPGSGVGIVVLKRLEDALADGDYIYALIKGSAVNNDGAMKVGYTAPGVEGQARVIRAAHLAAEVDPATITYIETHGTGTPLGDPIEIDALIQAFRVATEATGYCALGSVKTNLGHLDAAAGVTGLIKTVQALKHALLPPSLHFKQPNPRIDFAHSPFYVNTALTPWKTNQVPRRAGVSAFGIGGTNAHVLLEEAPPRESTGKARAWHLLVLSARTDTALTAMTTNLARHLELHPELSLSNAAYTCQVGRKMLPHRRAFVCSDREDAIHVLNTLPPERVFTHMQQMDKRSVAFMFPGQGMQYVGMAKEIYHEEPTFREVVDYCAEFLRPLLGFDLRHILYPQKDQAEEAERQLQQTITAQPALFVIEYALAQLWIKWGIQPRALIGHSLGEYVAACLAGVFSLEDALAIVFRKGQMMQNLPGGSMLSIPLPEQLIRPRLSTGLSISAVNAPALCVVSGPVDELSAFQDRLTEQGVDCRRLYISNASHSSMMEPILKPFAEYIATIPLNPPQIPYISNVTGTWITASEATDPAYWARHLRQTVRFADGVQRLLADPTLVFLEIGPGQTLSTLTRQQLDTSGGRFVVPSLRHPQDHCADGEFLQAALGKLWLAGVEANWPAVYTDERPHRIPLPTYPFERQRYWIEARGRHLQATLPQAAAAEEADTIDQPAVETPFSLHLRPILLTSYVAPRNECEQTIATIWQELLGIAQVGIHDHFFELGGHSLLGTQLVSRLYDTFHVKLTVRSLFEAPTIAKLAAIILQDLAEQGTGEERSSFSQPSIAPQKRESTFFPLSYAQQRFFFLDQWEPDSPLYNVSLTVHLTGQLEVRVLERVLNTLVERHEALRTTFSIVDGQPVQAISPALPMTFPILDLTRLDEQARKAQVQHLVNKEAQLPFDLTRGPLVRLHLLRLSTKSHSLLLTMHHIISDGWSLNIFVQELADLYGAFAAEKPSPLPELPIQYVDFALWQPGWLQGETLKIQLDYWKRQLDGASPVLELPVDHPRPAIQTSQGAHYTFAIQQSLSEKIKVLSNSEETTLFMTLLAAFQALLFRYTGQTDISLGTPIANRTRSDIEPLIGCFVNTLVLRGCLSGDQSFHALLKQVRGIALEAYAHQDLPFERLVEELQPQRDLSHSPLFQVMFILRNASKSVHASPGLVLQTREVDNGTAKFDLTLTMTESGTGLAGMFEFKTDLFETATIARMARHFCTLLESIVTNPAQPLSLLTLLTEAEQQQLLVEWNATQAPYPRDMCFHQLFEMQVERTPDAIAVVCEEEHLTYRALNRRANQLAHYLQRLAIGPEKCVGLYMQRSLEIMVGLIAILKAGAAFVPLDPASPVERLGFMIADARLSLLLTHKHLLANMANLSLEVDVIALDTAVFATENEENPGNSVLPENLAYVIYTSGSTGRPRGVMIPHRGFVNYLHWCTRTYGLAEGQGTLVHSPISFDLTITGLFAPLIQGQRVALLPGGEEVETLASALQSGDDYSFLKLTPTHLELLSNLLPGKYAACAQTLIIGGEALRGEHLSFWRTHAPGTRLINEYGPTETVVGCCVYEVPGEALLTGTIPIGRPITNMQIYVLDAFYQPLPVGVPGELYIAGDGLARGYLSHPEKTAERFIPNPFSREPGQRLYRTGDVARYLPGGVLEYLGRNDEQIKLRGFRIEPGEVEAVLEEHPDVFTAIVLLCEDMSGDRFLVAYVVPQAGSAPTGSALRTFLKDRLPVYMLPSAFVLLETLTLTPNGKIDRRALPLPGNTGPGPGGSFARPRNSVEERVLATWKTVLRLEEAGIHDDFFASGGHSLLAITLISRLREAFQVDLPLRSLFEAPSVAELASVIIQLKDVDRGTADASSSWPTIIPEPGQRSQPFPLTDVQQAYWIGQTGLFELGNVATHAYIELESDRLDLRRLNLAWQRLIERHDMLRAIVLPDGQQQILEQVPAYHIAILDLRGQRPEEVAAQLEVVRQSMSHQVLPTDQWPLFEIRASYLDNHRVRLHLSADALMIDAGSWQILGHELSLFYQDPEAILPPLELSFRDYVLAERAFTASEAYQRSQAYWWERLSSLPPAPELPLAQSPALLTEPHFVRRQARLEAQTWSRLKAQATGQGLTPSALLLAAFAEILTTWSKSPHFTINLTLFNRLPLHPQVQQIIGDFTSLTLLEVDNSQPAPFEMRARRLQERLWEDLDHRHVSGVRVLRELARRQEEGILRAVMPIVFTSTLTQERRTQAVSPFGTAVYGISQTPQIWLDHQVSEQEGMLVLNWDAVEALFPPGLLDEMFDAYHRFLLDLATTEENWQAPIRQLVPPGQLEQRAIVNASTAPVAAELLHTSFMDQARLRPAQVAVIAPDRVLTYGELYSIANQLGRQLRNMRACPNTLVAVVMEKGWEQVVAVLGILQSGAAYLPIDPTLPEERLWYLLRHGEVGIVLTQPWLATRLAWPEDVQVQSVNSITDTDDSPLEPVQQENDLAYVIYTSGSTGQPKGVMIDHRSALNTVVDINRRFRVGPEDRVLALSSLSFDLSVYDIFGLLAAGGTIVFPAVASLQDPSHWARLMVQEKITLWNTVPALMSMLVEYAAGRSEVLPSSLRLVLLSGDWIPLTLPDQIKALVKEARVISLGGATEAAIWSILYPIETIDPAWHSIPYGKPMRNQRFHVLNESLEDAPNWVHGQLYIGGSGLAKGYWRDEARTSTSFVYHPRTGERLYRTGDLGRYLPDGNIEFLGREDFQVKIQGYRVELGEIEAALSRHPEVHNAVVIAAGQSQFNEYLVGYVVPHGIITAHQLRSFLQEHLPTYMIPAVFMLLDALPLTANGKIDRKRLPDPSAAYLVPPSDLKATNTAFTGQIAGLVASILSIDAVDPTVNLMDIGATSIDMVRIVNLLERELHFRPNVIEFYRSPTVAGLARFYEAHLLRSQKAGVASPTASQGREEGEI